MGGQKHALTKICHFWTVAGQNLLLLLGQGFFFPRSHTNRPVFFFAVDAISQKNQLSKTIVWSVPKRETDFFSKFTSGGVFIGAIIFSSFPFLFGLSELKAPSFYWRQRETWLQSPPSEIFGKRKTISNRAKEYIWQRVSSKLGVFFWLYQTGTHSKKNSRESFLGYGIFGGNIVVIRVSPFLGKSQPSLVS